MFALNVLMWIMIVFAGVSVVLAIATSTALVISIIKDLFED